MTIGLWGLVAILLGGPGAAALPKEVSEITEDELRVAIVVAASRTNAYYGFNAPEVQLYLPRVPNSPLAEIEMLPPRLVDANGGEVPFVLERGLYDADSHSLEIRFFAEDELSPAEHSHAIGEIRMVYPLVAETDGGDGYAPGRPVEVVIRYEVPIADPLPEDQRGVPLEGDAVAVMDPASRVEIEISASVASTASVAVAAGESVPVREGGALSPSAQTVALAIEELERAVGRPISVVQMMFSPPAMLSVSAESGGAVEEWTWSNGAMQGPSAVDTSWLQCKSGLPAEAFDLRRFPALLDDASSRVGGSDLMQAMVGQGPCGTPSIAVTFVGGSWAQYEGDGRFVRVELNP